MATLEQINEALIGRTGEQTWRFRYELLDLNGIHINDLTSVTSCTVEFDADAEIHRSGRISLTEKEAINYASDRVRPLAQLKIPGTDEWVSWPLGEYLLSSPSRSSRGITTGVDRDIEMYDQCVALLGDKVTDRYIVLAGVVVVDTVESILTGYRIDKTPDTSTLLRSLEWDPGTPKLTIINDLLDQINYENVHFDAIGRAVLKPYKKAAERSPIWVYEPGIDSVILDETTQNLDLFNIPNVYTLVATNFDTDEVLTSTYTNDNPVSPLSTVSRGRSIVEFRDNEEAVDQETLDAKAERLALEMSDVYERISFSTGFMPFHGYKDVVKLRLPEYGVDAKYTEYTWSLTLEIGQPMTHNAYRVQQL